MIRMNHHISSFEQSNNLTGSQITSHFLSESTYGMTSRHQRRLVVSIQVDSTTFSVLPFDQVAVHVCFLNVVQIDLWNDGSTSTQVSCVELSRFNTIFQSSLLTKLLYMYVF